MKHFTFSLLTILLTTSGFAQEKIEQSTKAVNPSVIEDSALRITEEAISIFQGHLTDRSNHISPPHYQPGKLAPSIFKNDLNATYDPQTGALIAVRGTIPGISDLETHAERCVQYLQSIKGVYHLDDVLSQIEVLESITDDKGRLHTKLDQVHKGIKIYGGELTIHEAANDIYMVQGSTRDIQDDLPTIPTINEAEAVTIAKQAVDKYVALSAKVRALFTRDQVTASLVIYPHGGTHVLAWDVDIFATLADRETMIIDATSGAILHRYGTLCKYHDHTMMNAFDGKALGNGQDLDGRSQTINVYDCTGSYFLVDASRAMYKGGTGTSCSNSERLLNGVIMTLDAGNTSPGNDNFDYDIASSTSINNWNDPIAISAHINGGRAYEYFRNTFGRESITGNGTNIVSFINVADQDGTRMDNAFWNGEFIFYGSGKQAFNAPLAKALDVAGHEMSHGVIQTAANLRYEGESGALNEHFADVFGVLIENEDFRIGEDVTNSAIFPTGALRSMSDPNNGGNRVGDPGYQPAHVDEQYRGADDNGGVHLNSGIPNLAFFKFVTDERFGADINERAGIAQQIWYKTLTQYLRSTSNFSDMRVAVIQTASEDYGSVVAEAAAKAFDEVGILGANVTPEVEDFDTNPGDEYVVWSDVGKSNVNISTGVGNDFGQPSATDHISRPSTTDDGRFIIFVNDQKQIQGVEIDWSTESVVREFLVGSEMIWRNAVISKDGSKIAAITGDLAAGEFENKIFIFDLVSGTQRSFDLFNPTFSEGNTATGGVLYADVMEFDHSGEQLIYDAFNQLSGTFGQDLSYWDIGILNVWDNTTDDFGDGNIFKLFSGLPKDVSIGNPTFSKNSPNIIAFDFREIDPETNEASYSILGLDRETRTVNQIFENNTFGYPSYSLTDQDLIFHFLNSNVDILAKTSLGIDKISADGDAFVFTQNAAWGIYMGTGSRDLTTATESLSQSDILNVYPSPASDRLFVEVASSDRQNENVQLYDLQGQLLVQYENIPGEGIDISNLRAGTYILKYQSITGTHTRKIIKI